MDETAAARITTYCRAAGLARLAGRERDVERAIHDLIEAMAEKIDVGDGASLYSYPIPILAPDGSCAAGDELAPVPYDLAPILGGRSEQTTRRLALAERLVERVQETTGSDWVGIYQRRPNAYGEPVLVKLAYVGKPSRAEFPLASEFATRSTNSSVGLTGQAIVIEDVRRHVETGGAFYVCDANVRSEACLPVFGADLAIVGIIDAEAHAPGLFTAERLAILAALAIVVPAVLP